ncbi:hypothetical protein BMS3Bbin04_01405 [bacterium BMS3Bbin04]|nr:hypothetical protein BMS3Bbin04_01405 [bacterium BMS3Bbin04]
MTEFSLTIRDIIWFGSLVVTVMLAYSRIRIELRHLDDTKTDRAELHLLTDDLRSRLEDIRMSVTRMEEALRRRPGSIYPPNEPSPTVDI